MLINAQPKSKKEAFLPSVFLTAREQVAHRGPQAQQEHGLLCLLLAGHHIDWSHSFQLYCQTCLGLNKLAPVN